MGCRTIILLSLLKCCSSEPSMVHVFSPKSSVTDHAAIDLDQEEVEFELAKGTIEGFENAEAIYKMGAHSKPYAMITIETPLLQELPAGTFVRGPSISGNETTGKLLDVAKRGDTILRVQYSTTDDKSNHVGCQVGASLNPKVDLCLADNGTIIVGSTIQQKFQYSYNHTEDNENFRTLQGFSLQANQKMTGYVDFEKFRSYYGIPNYGDEWILAAFEGRKTRFPNLGNVDFAKVDRLARTESVKRAMIVMNVWMYTVREFEDALDDCEDNCSVDGCNDDKVSAWDEGVAFYSGSKVDEAKSYSIFALANEVCENYRTCDRGADELGGNSVINIENFRLFNKGQSLLLKAQCDEVRKIKEEIVNLMILPLIQGSMKHAFDLEQNMEDWQKEGKDILVEQVQAEGQVFTQAVLPLLHACSPEDAEIVREHMQINSNTRPVYLDVKYAYERNYECMGVSCEMVGALVNEFQPERYVYDQQPCSDMWKIELEKDKKDEKSSAFLSSSIVGIMITTIFATVTIYLY